MNAAQARKKTDEVIAATNLRRELAREQARKEEAARIEQERSARHAERWDTLLKEIMSYIAVAAYNGEGFRCVAFMPEDAILYQTMREHLRSMGYCCEECATNFRGERRLDVSW